ncbi:MAG: hypothetical protein KAR87_01345 [Candidatus Aenigmarchaeota archaeon]|nr:hypothetical protein [Candidatus Aenigmarchaeota archaeon]
MIANINIINISASNKIDFKKQEKKIEIGNMLSIKNVVENTDSKTIAISFEFKIIYKTEKEELGDVIFLGSLLWKEDDSENTFKTTWEKDKKLPEKHSFVIMNSILRKCILSAIDIAQQINMPPPINIPVIQEKKVQNIEYIG